MISINQLIELNEEGFKLWVENGKLKYRQIKESGHKERLLNWVKENKLDLVNILNLNQLNTPDYALPYIYKLPNENKCLSFAQERLWFIDQYENGTNAYNVPLFYALSKEVSLDHLKHAIRKVVERHDVLHSLIKKDESGVGYQEVIDISDMPLIIKQQIVMDNEELNEALKSEAKHFFDLSKNYPINVAIYTVQSTGLSYLSFVIHHIAFDAWSSEVLIQDIAAYYTNQSNDQDNNIFIQYKDFASWQRAYLTEEKLNQELIYWKNQLKDVETLNLMTDKPRPIEFDYKGKEINFKIDEKTSEKLRVLAKNCGVSLYNVLLAAYYLLLSTYSNQDDIILGTPVANRHYSQLQSLIGFFVNSLALRIKVDGNESLIDFIHRVNRMVTDAQLHQDLPFEKIVEELHLPKDTSRHPLFQVLFGLQSQQIEMKQTLLKPYQLDTAVSAKFDLATFIDDSKQELCGWFNYAESLFDKETIESFIQTYKIILTQFSALLSNESKKVSEVEYVDSALNNNEIAVSNFNCQNTLHDLFEEQVKKNPKNIAIVSQGRKITYAELNSIANQLASYIKENFNINNNDLIGLCVDRNENILIGILGILKAGGAYVPIDPAVPDARIEFLLADTKTKLVLTQKNYVERVNQLLQKSNLSINIIALDQEELTAKLKAYPQSNPDYAIGSDNLAYVIYTSGTTGKPKGVMQPHKNVVRLFRSLDEIYQFNADDVWSLFHAFTFDFSVWEIWGAFIYGGKLLVPSYEETRDPKLFYQLCDSEGLTVLNQTPGAFYQFLNMLHISQQKLSNLRLVILGGEALNTQQIKPFFEIYHNASTKLINMYGITETTVHVTYKQIKSPISEYASSIGISLPDMTTFVLNKYLKRLPLGAIGELYIGGEGLAYGYLNQPVLTQERFISHPFCHQDNNKLYKSGDLVRRKHNGELEYIGRNDFQIKLRGFRIELGEIERALVQHNLIIQATVILKELSPSNKKIIAYYTSMQPIDSADLIVFLSENLPEYMIPSAFVHLKEIPLTINGKVDRKALPEPELISANKYIGPRNKIESDVVTVWSDLLALDSNKIGIDDDFFRLGGDSIISIQLVSRLRQKLNIELKVKDIFIHKTIRNLSDASLLEITYNKPVKLQSEQGLLSGEFDLLPIQKWFFACDFNNANHWNQSFMIQTPELQLEKLKDSLKKLVIHHDAFRLRFKKNEQGNVIQYYDSMLLPEQMLLLDVRSLGFAENTQEFNQSLQKKLTEWQSGFNIIDGPTYLTAYLYGYADRTARIYFSFHHLIVDAVSWRILMEDLYALYNGKKLEAKQSSYRQWVNIVQEYAVTNKVEKLYWEECLKDYMQANQAAQFQEHGTEVNATSFSLSQEMTEKLLRQCGKVYQTKINEILLSAFALALHAVTGNETHYVTLEGHGREEINSSINVARTMGWFTILYPVKLDVDLNIANTLIATKETLRKIPNNGIGFGALLDEYLDSLPKISFNFLGQFLSNSNEKQAWCISSEMSGETISKKNKPPFLIESNGLIIDHQLQFHIRSQLNNEFTMYLASLFEQKLIEVIQFLSVQTRSFLTSSDVNYIVEQPYIEKLQAENEIAGIYLANSLQQGFIYHSLSQGNIDDAYIVQSVLSYDTAISFSLLKRAWKYAIDKFPALRLRFAWDNQLIQIIDKNAELDWRYLDLSSDQREEKQKEIIDNLLKQDRKEQFNLSKSGLFRIYLIKKDEKHFVLIFSNHHIILDGWATNLLLKYVHETYLKLQAKRLIEVEVDQAYKRAQKYIQTHSHENELFWNKFLTEITEHPDLSGLLLPEYKETNLKEYKYIKNQQQISLIIKNEVYKKLKEVSVMKGLTLNAILQYAWHTILSVYGNCNQTVVGMTVSGRHLPILDIEKSVGLYINTLPLIVKHDKEQTVLDTIRKIQADISEVNTHGHAELAKLQKAGERLFESLFVYENYPREKNDEIKNLLKFSFADCIEKLDYPLVVVVNEEDNGILFNIKYAGELFNHSVLQSLLNTLYEILSQVSLDEEIKNKDLSYLNKVEKEKILMNWNKTEKDYCSEKTIHQMIEEQVAKTPNEIAVIYEGIQLTYRELNEKANQLAHFLQNKFDIKPDDLIAVCLDRSAHMLITLLAILKSGGAYVPLVPDFPQDRISYILEDTKAKVVLVDEEYLQKLVSAKDNVTGKKPVILSVEDQFVLDEISKYSTKNPTSLTNSKNLAYVIYTSGTTGQPKGVMSIHQGIINLINWLQDTYPLTVGDKSLQKTTYVFDDSVYELFWPSFYGACNVFAKPEGHKDPAYLIELMNKESISIVSFVPSILGICLDEMERLYIQYGNSIVPSLKYMLCSGEALPISQIKKIHQFLPYTTVHNLYGPTEASVDVTYYDCSQKDLNMISIGKPIYNTTAYIVDAYQRPMPIGAIGELYIGGDGLARGYLNRDQLTQEKFVSNPFQTTAQRNRQKNAVLYRTGDLARWLPDGNIDFLGRNDFQVKIRGNRIELTEIEAVLSQYPGIKHAVVLVKENEFLQSGQVGNKYLIGYYVADEALNEAAMIEYMSTQLPEYMVPNMLVHLKTLPLTINGKLDRNALPTPSFINLENFVNPRDETEAELTAIWSSILGIMADKISIKDDFFRLGGNSILSIMLLSKVNAKFNIKLNLSDFFKDKLMRNIESMASLIKQFKEMSLENSENEYEELFHE